MIIDKLKPLEKESIERGIPIIGSVKGKWLHNKIIKLKPKRVLELGTANGYSGIILTSEGAELTTVEIDWKIAKEAEINFKKFGVNPKIIIDDAINVVKHLKEKFDLIFLDIEKNKYLSVLDGCISLLNSRGCIIADNISFESCQDYKKAVLSHPKLKTEIINIENGLAFSRLIYPSIHHML